MGNTQQPPPVPANAASKVDSSALEEDLAALRLLAELRRRAAEAEECRVTAAAERDGLAQERQARMVGLGNPFGPGASFHYEAAVCGG